MYYNIAHVFLNFFFYCGLRWVAHGLYCVNLPKWEPSGVLSRPTCRALLLSIIFIPITIINSIKIISTTFGFKKEITHFLRADTTDWMISWESGQTPSKQRLRHQVLKVVPSFQSFRHFAGSYRYLPQDGSVPILYRRDHNAVVGMGQQRWGQSNLKE